MKPQADFQYERGGRPRYGVRGREKLLQPYLKRNEWLGGTRDFDNVPLSVLEELVDKEFLDPSERQNESPTVRQFMDFMADWKREGMDVRAHGYEVSADRGDTRVSIEGLRVWSKPIKGFAFAWETFNKKADELSDTRSWWD